MNKIGKAKHAKTKCLPIGEVLANIESEKIPKNPIPVCLPPSLANYVKAHGGSPFIRENLVENLRRKFEDEEERKARREFEGSSP